MILASHITLLLWYVLKAIYSKDVKLFFFWGGGIIFLNIKFGGYMYTPLFLPPPPMCEAIILILLMDLEYGCSGYYDRVKIVVNLGLLYSLSLNGTIVHPVGKERMC